MKTSLYYEWDEDKDQKNQHRHGLSFADALSVFDDPSLLSMYDPHHSQNEDRWISLGRNSAGTVVLVVHTVRGEPPADRIRLISARYVSKHEERQYYSRVQS